MIFVEEREELPICDTCKSQIDFSPYRLVRIMDKNLEFKELIYHYFFPCWDIDYFMQNHKGSQIISSGFSCDTEILEKPLVIKNMEKNLDLWI